MSRFIFTISSSIGRAAYAVPAIYKVTKDHGVQPDFVFTNRKGYHEGVKTLLRQFFDDPHFIKPSQANKKDHSGFVGLMGNTSFYKQKGIPSKYKGYRKYRFKVSEPAWFLNAYTKNWNDNDLTQTIPNKLQGNDEYDIIFVNGYTKVAGARWVVKEYPYWEQVAAAFKLMGYSCASIGSKQEHVKGTVNKCGLPMIKSLEYIKGAKLVIGNDTGMVHVASLLKKPVVYVITCVNETRVYDERFHWTAKPIFIRPFDMCPCQNLQNGNYAWLKNKCGQECREISPHKLFTTSITHMSDQKIQRAGQFKNT